MPLLTVNTLLSPMKTTRISAGFVEALCFIWMINPATGSGKVWAPDVVTGARGGSATVKCQYDREFADNTKYWCKGQVYVQCEIVVKTPRNRPSDRFFIEDDKEAAVFTISMNSLRDSDEDLYWCVIAKSGLNSRSPVRLLIAAEAVQVTPTAMWIPEHDDNSWWLTLRWILFASMLSCSLSVHIAQWWKERRKNDVT